LTDALTLTTRASRLLLLKLRKKIVTILPTNVNENGNTVEKTEKCNQQEQ
jgi:hypothetical protein